MPGMPGRQRTRRHPLSLISRPLGKANATIADPFTWAKRLEVLRPFATFSQSTAKPLLLRHQPLRSHETSACPAYLYYRRDHGHHRRRRTGRVQAAGTLMMPALVGLLAATGLRISEALSLQLRDLDLEAAQILVREAKYGLLALSPLYGGFPITTITGESRLMWLASLASELNQLAKSVPVSNLIDMQQIWLLSVKEAQGIVILSIILTNLQTLNL